MIASHSGVHALCTYSRNLTDDQLDAIGSSGGLVGINFDVGSLRADGGDDADTPIAKIAEHARYVAARIGVDNVALGSDFDGAPLIASHSGVHALAPASRNLTDAQLDAIAASGGLVGVVYAVRFVRADGAEDLDTPLETIAAHVRHVADRIGVDHVGFGSDFDGGEIPSALGDAAGLPRLLEALRADGFTEEELRAIAWDNWRRVLEHAWQR